MAFSQTIFIHIIQFKWRVSGFEDQNFINLQVQSTEQEGDEIYYTRKNLQRLSFILDITRKGANQTVLFCVTVLGLCVVG